MNIVLASRVAGLGSQIFYLPMLICTYVPTLTYTVELTLPTSYPHFTLTTHFTSTVQSPKNALLSIKRPTLSRCVSK